MKVAIPEHQGRIAPVFDNCRRILVFLQTPEQDRLVSNEDWSCVERLSRADRLRDIGIEILMCGGISCRLEQQIVQRGIRLVPWLAGDVYEVLAAFKEGRVSDPCFAMPGRRGCRVRRRGRLFVGRNHTETFTS